MTENLVPESGVPSFKFDKVRRIHVSKSNQTFPAWRAEQAVKVLPQNAKEQPEKIY